MGTCLVQVWFARCLPQKILSRVFDPHYIRGDVYVWTKS